MWPATWGSILPSVLWSLTFFLPITCSISYAAAVPFAKMCMFGATWPKALYLTGIIQKVERIYHLTHSSFFIFNLPSWTLNSHPRPPTRPLGTPDSNPRSLTLPGLPTPAQDPSPSRDSQLLPGLPTPAQDLTQLTKFCVINIWVHTQEDIHYCLLTLTWDLWDLQAANNSIDDGSKSLATIGDLLQYQ